jgi:hypothetical protein
MFGTKFAHDGPTHDHLFEEWPNYPLANFSKRYRLRCHLT